MNIAIRCKRTQWSAADLLRRWVPHQMHGTSRKFGGEAQWMGCVWMRVDTSAGRGRELKKLWQGEPAGEGFDGLFVCHWTGKNSTRHRICTYLLTCSAGYPGSVMLTSEYINICWRSESECLQEFKGGHSHPSPRWWGFHGAVVGGALNLHTTHPERRT